MLGAIIGDLAAARSLSEIRDTAESGELVPDDARLSADGCLTLAVAAGVMDYLQYAETKGTPTGGHPTAFNRPALKSYTIHRLQETGRRYTDAGYSAEFKEWLKQDDPRPSSLCSSEPAGRISSIGFIGRSESEIMFFSSAVTKVTHKAFTAQKGAEAAALAVFWARQGYSREAIRERIHRHYYKLNFSMHQMSEVNGGNEMPPAEARAIKCFLESHSFEDTIRHASAADRDGSALAVMAGAIAEAHYGIPAAIKAKALQHLDGHQRQIYDRFLDLRSL